MNSAGSALSRSPAGRLALILAELAGAGLEAGNLIALLAHPLARLGLDRSTCERGRAAIDIALTRGRRLPETLEGLSHALAEVSRETPEHAAKPRSRLGVADFAAAGALIAALDGALAPLLAAARRENAGLPDLAEAHSGALDAVTRLPDGSSALAGQDAEALIALFADLAECDETGPEIPAVSYAQALRMLMDARAVTPSSPGHRRVKIGACSRHGCSTPMWRCWAASSKAHGPPASPPIRSSIAAFARSSA